MGLSQILQMLIATKIQVEEENGIVVSFMNGFWKYCINFTLKEICQWNFLIVVPSTGLDDNETGVKW